MGDRVSVSFAQDTKESVVLFHHWGGKEFPLLAQQFVKQWISFHPPNAQYRTPANRADPEMMMVQFIAWLAKNSRGPNEGEQMLIAFVRKAEAGSFVSDSMYLGATENDGDNSDNGHWRVNVEDGTFLP